MPKPSVLLDSLIEKDMSAISKALADIEQPLLAAIDFIRQIDIVFISGLTNLKLSKSEKELLEERYKYGWFYPLSELMLRISGSQPLFAYSSNEENKYWADSVIQVSGKLQLCKRFVQLEEAALVTIFQMENNKFEFDYNHAFVDLERYDRDSYAFVLELFSKTLEPKYKEHIKNKRRIQQLIDGIVQNPGGQFISYITTPEIDDYYSKLGYFYLVQHHGYEEFSEHDEFGGIPYKHYLDFVEDLAGVALKHIDCCLSLFTKNQKVDPYNLFTYSWDKSDTIKRYADHFSLPEEKMDQIIACLTLSQDNISYYKQSSPFITPPYLQLGNSILTRSVYGCLSGAVSFLKMELKRKFERDYFKAVNNRERRFRRDLYSLLPENRLIKIDKEVVINKGSMQTDIDAIIFDPLTRTLGLFQLKWQDTFGTSLKERYSRMTNVIPKSVEWIDKIVNWISTTDQTAILERLGLQNQPGAIGDIYLFIVARNHIHFTGHELDERAAWSSWYQLVHSINTIKATFDDPIRELFVKTKFNSPENRIQREGYPELFPLKIALEKFSLSYRKRK